MVKYRSIERENGKFFYCREEEEDNPPVDKIIAFRDAFKHYKNSYFYTLKPLLPLSANPGYEALCQCGFQNPIDQEATGQLAEILGLETPINHETRTCPWSDKRRLREEYRAHHSYLRAVRKFYSSRLIYKNNSYGEFVATNGKINLQQQIPLPSSLRAEIEKDVSVSADHYLKSSDQTLSLMMKDRGLRNPTHSNWPGYIIDQSYFLGRANFRVTGVQLPKDHRNIQPTLNAVAEDVGLFEILR